MGEQSTFYGTNKQRLKFISSLLEDVDVLERMIDGNKFTDGDIYIGTEQEICILNNEFDPADNALDLLEKINDPAFTTELAIYNLELNTDPIKLGDGSFFKMHETILKKLNAASQVAEAENSHLIISGILPTIRSEHINLEYLTPLPRYHFMNDMLRKLRGDDFRIFLRGVDDLSLRNNTVMLEACNTSFQMHLQIDPKEFPRMYNWALIISAPLLAISTNSPLLMGKELWSETRIALFQQSIDTRQSTYAIRERKPRVTFASRWIRNSITEIFKEDIARHQILISSDETESPSDLLENGQIPSLKSLRLHNGTVYRWNRPCYGVKDNEPHLRIENRYIPAGPSVFDEVANTAFWIGLMLGNPYQNPPDFFSFRDIKSNFYKAARTGVESVFVWRGKLISVKDLILNELLPLAYQGLRKAKVGHEEIQKYLGVIEKRANSHTGSQWQVNNFRTLKKNFGTNKALHYLTRLMFEYQAHDVPVHEWKNITKEFIESADINFHHVDEIMSTDLLTVHPDDALELVARIMSWRTINHVPVEDYKGNLKGIITSHDILELEKKYSSFRDIAVKQVMKKNVITIASGSPLPMAKEMLEKNDISCLPVMEKGIVIGIITRKDFEKRNLD